MLSLLLATTLAAAPAPRALDSATTAVHIPQLDKLSGLHAFMSRAGTYAALLRPSTWIPEFHPFLALDPLRPETLTAVGIDPAGPTTLSFIRSGEVSCSRLADPKAFQAKANEALTSTTPVKTATAKGLTTASAPRGTGRAGYVLKGQEACSFATRYDDDDLLKDTVKLMGKAPAPDARLGKLPGAVYVLQGPTVVGLDGTADGLQAEGTATRLPLPPFQTSGSSPYGAMKLEGLLFSRAQVAPAGLSQAVGAVRYSIQQICASCQPEQVQAVAQAVTQQLTGHLLMLVDSVQVKASLRTPEGRFFAPRQAVAAQVKDAAKLKEALAPLARFPGAQALENGYSLALKGGTVFVLQKGQQLILGNDEAVVKTLLDSLSEKGAKLPHAVDFTADPKKVARGLSQVSLIDIMSNQQLVGLFAMSAEAGSLLSNSERISGWLDSAPGGGHRFSLTWTLPASTGKP
ncbi:hypothetical protein [Hyalangium sp.]|uniref:hypothetical protein n=1 Tax=Hyalangium sp. TaxID=2028555 RepID=UPI002D40D7EE|nr:hypothetical protein [Hyalangium sp.]HYI00535.1 hypothetical protein [Hyalangium sp.]